MARVQMPGPCDLVLPETATVDEWLHARTFGVGGSEVAALLRQSPYATSFDVFRNKVDEHGKPRYQGPPPVGGKRVRPELLVDDPVLEFGHRLEAAVVLKTADELGLVPRSGGGLYRHREHPVVLVTPDAVATKRRSYKPVCLIEAKTTGGAWEDAEAPEQYRVQAQWQMGVTGIHTCFIGSFVLGYEREFQIDEITFDPDYFGELVEAAETFWRENVLTGNPPMHDLRHKRTEDLLKELHPSVEYETVQLPEGAEEWLEAHEQAKAALKTVKDNLLEITNWIRMHMGDAAGGYIGEDKVCSYPEVRTRRVLVGKLRERYPEIAKELEEESVHRRLTIKKRAQRSA
jgi:predicted phage-related endonuclease